MPCWGRVRAELQVKAQDPRIFQFLVEKSPDGHFVVREGTFEYLNEAALRMFGYEGQGFGKLTVSDILHSSDHDRARRNMALRSSGVLRGSASYLAQRRDGSTFPIEVHAAPVQRGEKRGIHGVIRDITARRTMEKQLEEMQRTSVVSRLASGISHDFNNLLAVIQTNAEVAMREVGSSGDAGVSLQRIRAAAQRGAQKVRQIQQIGGNRPEQERFQPLHINPVVEDVLDLTRARWQDEADSRGVSYDVRWNPGAASPIDGSSSDLRAAVVALIFNGLEAMPEGGELALRTGETEHGEVLIELKDSGEGIRREDISRLTDAFFTTRSDRRMGLGLHLVQMFIERHGGRLDVRSTRGAGSTFSMILPASDEAPEEPARPLRPDLHAPRSGPPRPEPARPRPRGWRVELARGSSGRGRRHRQKVALLDRYSVVGEPDSRVGC